MDALVYDISRTRTFWKSKFSTLLQTSVAKQWQPILLDMQAGLRTIGGNLLCLGLVEVIGRPVMMLYPIYIVCMESLQLISEFETTKRISHQSILKIFKILVYLFISFQLMALLSMYTGLGYSCLLLGAVALLYAK